MSLSRNARSYVHTKRRRSLTVACILAGCLLVTMLGAGSALSAEPGPIHAGNTYGWYHGHNLWREEFHGPLSRNWRRAGHGSVRTQNGMLTIESGRGTVSATLRHHAHRYGRWEVRLRSRHTGGSTNNYRVVTALVPARASAYHCGGQNIALSDYRLGRDRVRFYAHTLPDRTFRATKGLRLRNDQWHTFAVEVTRTHISWFIDAHVVRTERRSAALSGIPLTLRFSLEADPGTRPHRARLQADWMRYWTYNRPSTKSIKAPRMDEATFRQSC